MYIWLWLAAGIVVSHAPEEALFYLQLTRNSWYFLLRSLFSLGDSINGKIHIKLSVIHFLCTEWNTNLSDGPEFNFLLTEKQRRQRPDWTRDQELIYGLCKKTHSQSRIVLPANHIHCRWFFSPFHKPTPFLIAPGFIFHIFPMSFFLNHSLISINYKSS